MNSAVGIIDYRGDSVLLFILGWYSLKVNGKFACAIKKFCIHAHIKTNPMEIIKHESMK